MKIGFILFNLDLTFDLRLFHLYDGVLAWDQ